MSQSGPGAEDDSGGEAPPVQTGEQVGRLVESSQAEDRRMIRLVRARPLLYARSNLPVARYYAHVRRLWGEVAADMGWTVAEVRRKWSHVRNSYSRHLRNEAAGARTGRGRAVSRWYLADELAFLRDHMATDTRAAPYSTFAPTLLHLQLEPEDAEAESEAGPEPVDVKPAPGAWPGPASPRDDASSASSQPAGVAGDASAAYYQFFRGIEGAYLALGSARRRAFQRRCLSALHALLDEQDASLPAGPSDRDPIDGYSILPND